MTIKGEYHPTHKQLVRRIAMWQKSRHQSSIVMAEFVTMAQEIPDVIAWQSGAHSVLIECKASRSDFLSDKEKFFRKQEDYAMGNHRYYASPIGMIKPTELPDGWGLLEVDTYRIKTIVEAKLKDANKRRECMMLMSALRRLEISTAVFVRHDTEIEDARAGGDRDAIATIIWDACKEFDSVSTVNVNDYADQVLRYVATAPVA